jgi:glycosyltransferase involved in cell wall biosynthesis
LILCSKSPWIPAIRREHALAGAAKARGHDVMFIEQPRDVRWLRELGAGAWVSQLSGRRRRGDDGGVEVVARTTFVPPHRGSAAQVAESALLRRVLRACDRPEVAVVATTPWQWPAVSRLTRARKVFDCADDWAMLIPDRRAVIAQMLDRVGFEADAVIADTPWLASLFARPDVAVVRNATNDRLLATPLSDPPETRSMAYAGTLSERLDVELLSVLLSALADWRLDLYGECRYSGYREQPAPELGRLLAEFPGRIAWHGPVDREELASRLDGARVLLLPHRRRGAVRGDSMKLYDYAARGRPIVSTIWEDGLRETAPPGTSFADGAEEFVEAVARALDDDPQGASLRRAWAEANTWTSRWDAWAQAAFGPR